MLVLKDCFKIDSGCEEHKKFNGMYTSNISIDTSVIGYIVFGDLKIELNPYLDYWVSPYEFDGRCIKIHSYEPNQEDKNDKDINLSIKFGKDEYIKATQDEQTLIFTKEKLMKEIDLQYAINKSCNCIAAKTDDEHLDISTDNIKLIKFEDLNIECEKNKKYRMWIYDKVVELQSSITGHEDDYYQEGILFPKENNIVTIMENKEDKSLIIFNKDIGEKKSILERMIIKNNIETADFKPRVKTEQNKSDKNNKRYKFNTVSEIFQELSPGNGDTLILIDTKFCNGIIFDGIIVQTQCMQSYSLRFTDTKCLLEVTYLTSMTRHVANSIDLNENEYVTIEINCKKEVVITVRDEIKDIMNMIVIDDKCNNIKFDKDHKCFLIDHKNLDTIVFGDNTFETDEQRYWISLSRGDNTVIFSHKWRGVLGTTGITLNDNSYLSITEDLEKGSLIMKKIDREPVIDESKETLQQENPHVELIQKDDYDEKLYSVIDTFNNIITIVNSCNQLSQGSRENIKFILMNYVESLKVLNIEPCDEVCLGLVNQILSYTNKLL